MPTPYNKQNDHYVDAITRDKMSRLLHAEGMSHADIAYELRMTRTHVSGLLGGSKKMAHHHLLAMQFILIKARSDNLKQQRAEAAGETNE